MTVDTTGKWDLLLVVTSDRYGSERFSTVRRLIDAMLRAGHTVQVWACGYSMMLTQRDLLPGELREGSCGESSCGAGSSSGSAPPSSAEVIDRLAADQGERFSWVACEGCIRDPGANEHIASVRTRSVGGFRDLVANAAKVLYIGGP